MLGVFLSKSANSHRMEKFSTWRDKGTGISPFMPIEGAKASGLSKYLLSPVIFIAKLPIFVIALLIYSYVAPVPAVGEFILCTIFGLKTIEITVDGVKRSKKKEIDRLCPNINDVIIVNYIAPINGLILAAISKCSWRNIVILIPQGGQLYSHTIWDVITNTFFALNNINVAPTAEPVTSLLPLRGKLVYVFPEGTTSNNRSVLPFESFALDRDGFQSPFQLKTVLLKLSPANFTTPLPILSPFAYFYALLTNTNSKSTVRAKIFVHDDAKFLDLKLAKNDFEMNQLNSVGLDLDVSLKQKFYSEYLKVVRK